MRHSLTFNEKSNFLLLKIKFYPSASSDCCCCCLLWKVEERKIFSFSDVLVNAEDEEGSEEEMTHGWGIPLFHDV